MSNPITDRFFAIPSNHRGPIKAMALSIDNNYLFSTGEGQEVLVWLVDEWTLLCSLTIEDQSLDCARDLFVTPNNSYLV